MRFSGRGLVWFFMVLLVVPVLAVPPRVIETVPANGDRNVDPKVTEMRFVFDQDMATRGYSICGGGANFPKVVGRPRWADRRTLVARVTFVPGHEYRLSVNCASAKNCRSSRGEPAVPYPVTFRTAGGEPRAPSPRRTPQENAQAIRALRAAIDERYSYRDLRGLDWDELFAGHRGAMQQATTGAAFAQAAAELLAHARDMHIWLDADGDQIHPFRREITPNYNRAVLEKVVPDLRQRSAVVYTGQFEGGIGYILITSWSRDHTEALEQAYVAVWELSGAPGLIVDVRPNGGGAEPLAQDFAGCFVDRPVTYARHVYRSADEASGFTKSHERVLEPNKRRPKYRGKVVVLMGPANMSSCEAFLLMMKQVPDCTLLGGTSYGSSGNPKPTDLGPGVTVYLPSWKALRPDGTCFEGQGIAPDIPINTTTREPESADPVLQAGLTLLRRR